MGASGRWIKSLVGMKAEKAAAAGKGHKWPRLWRSNSSGSRAVGERGAPASEASSASADSFSSVVAAVTRAPPRDFRLIRQEWAAVRIQAAFRGFLARRALKALRGIVRLQALLRGRLVRRQLAVTFKCMRALLRVQERARERRARSAADGRGSHGGAAADRNGRACSTRDADVYGSSADGRACQGGGAVADCNGRACSTKDAEAYGSSADGRRSQGGTVADRNGRANSTKHAEEQWCDRQGSVHEVRSKLHMRHEGVPKRERAIAYALSHQLRSSKHSSRPSSPAKFVRSHESNGCNHNLSYIEGWMATKPWETRLMERNHTDSQFAKNCEELNHAVSKFSDASSVKIRRNNVTTRVAANPPSVATVSSSDFVCDESSPSSSSVTQMSATNILSSEARSDSGHVGGPNYMSLTKSAMARLDGYSSHRGSFQIQRQRSGDMSRGVLSSIDTQSNAGSEISVTSKRSNRMSLKGRSMTRSLDKENVNDH
ncbi:hypothetical protein ACP4OV_020240 [Aristida adscensionis]